MPAGQGTETVLPSSSRQAQGGNRRETAIARPDPQFSNRASEDAGNDNLLASMPALSRDRQAAPVGPRNSKLSRRKPDRRRCCCERRVARISTQKPSRPIAAVARAYSEARQSRVTPEGENTDLLEPRPSLNDLADRPGLIIAFDRRRLLTTFQSSRRSRVDRRFSALLRTTGMVARGPKEVHNKSEDFAKKL